MHRGGKDLADLEEADRMPASKDRRERGLTFVHFFDIKYT